MGVGESISIGATTGGNRAVEKENKEMLFYFSKKLQRLPLCHVVIRKDESCKG